MLEIPLKNKFINQIIRGDAKKILPLLPANSIDLIFTDPPYTKNYLHTYHYLAEECPRIMKSGASLVMVVGHYALEMVIKIFNQCLKYRWLLCMMQPGRNARMAMGIVVTFKPMLWYVKDNYRTGMGFLSDGITLAKDSRGMDKILHKWGQSPLWAEYYIKHLTKINELVLDPFCGSGTVPLVCKQLKRKFIGIDIDPNCVETSKIRLAKI